jgi:hypothetical protein
MDASRQAPRRVEPTLHHQARHNRAAPAVESDASAEQGAREGAKRSRRSGRAVARKARRRAPVNVVQNALLVVISMLIVYEIFHSLTAFISPTSWQSLIPSSFSASNQLMSGEPTQSLQRPPTAAEIARAITNQEHAATYGGGLVGGRQSGTQDSLSQRFPTRSGQDRHVVWSWFEQASSTFSKSLSDTADAATSAWAEAARYARDMRISAGLVQLPTLVVPPAAVEGTNDTWPRVEAVKDTAPGAAWSSSAWAALNSLPAYLKAVALHSAPKWTAEEAQAQLEERGSIFTARRKGEWMGCARPYHLICKGVYRAIKQVNAMTVLDTACMPNAHWLPLVIQHLRKEFRFVKLVCVVPDESRVQYVKAAFGDIEHVEFTTMDPFRDDVVNKTDLVVAVKLLDKKSMIQAMRFFKNMQRNAATASHVVFENYPDSRNRQTFAAAKTQSVRLNVFRPPFMFGKGIYRYQNTDEQPAREFVEVVTMETAELFSNKYSPAMADLEDPNLRNRRQEPSNRR